MLIEFVYRRGHSHSHDSCQDRRAGCGGNVRNGQLLWRGWPRVRWAALSVHTCLFCNIGWNKQFTCLPYYRFLLTARLWMFIGWSPNLMLIGVRIVSLHCQRICKYYPPTASTDILQIWITAAAYNTNTLYIPYPRIPSLASELRCFAANPSSISALKLASSPTYPIPVSRILSLQSCAATTPSATSSCTQR